MSDTTATTTAADDPVTHEKNNLIFTALAEAGIKTLVVHFDGYGDSGQIESIDGWAKPKSDYPDRLTGADSPSLPPASA